MSITEKRLTEIQARLEAATEGPWTVGDDDPEYIVFPEKGGYDGLVIAKVVDQDGALFPVEHNGQFIAHAPTDIADLLAEVEWLHDELTKTRAVTEDKVERAARALAAHWTDMHTNEALGRQRGLARHALYAALGGGDDA